MEYRKGDAPFHILIEEDGDIVFYETLIEKDDEEIIQDPDKNDEALQDYTNEK